MALFGEVSWKFSGQIGEETLNFLILQTYNMSMWVRLKMGFASI
jgi:hypothetical protein